MKKLVLLPLAFLTGCAATNQISDNFYQPSGKLNGTADVKIGLLQDPALRTDKIVVDGGFKCTIDVSSLDVVMQREMRTIFKDVHLLNEDAQCKDCDAFMLYALRPLTHDNVGNYSIVIDAEFLAKDKKTSLAKISIPYRGHTSGAIGTAAVSGALIGATMGLLTPIALPATAIANCNVLTEEAQKALSHILPMLSNEASRHPNLSEASIKGTSFDREYVPQTKDKKEVRVNTKYKKYLNATVVITTGDGQGSGFFVKDNLILTNQHVVGRNEIVTIHFADGSKSPGKVIAIDSRLDLAAVVVNESDAPILRFDDDPAQGDSLILVGAPFGLKWTVTRGILSASRLVDGVEHIQTDTPTSPGNSGGPLISLETGRVVGVITWKIGKKQSENLNFAVSAREAAGFLSRINY